MSSAFSLFAIFVAIAIAYQQNESSKRQIFIAEQQTQAAEKQNLLLEERLSDQVEMSGELVERLYELQNHNLRMESFRDHRSLLTDLNNRVSYLKSNNLEIYSCLEENCNWESLVATYRFNFEKIDGHLDDLESLKRRDEVLWESDIFDFLEALRVVRAAHFSSLNSLERAKSRLDFYEVAKNIKVTNESFQTEGHISRYRARADYALKNMRAASIR